MKLTPKKVVSPLNILMTFNPCMVKTAILLYSLTWVLVIKLKEPSIVAELFELPS